MTLPLAHSTSSEPKLPAPPLWLADTTPLQPLPSRLALKHCWRWPRVAWGSHVAAHRRSSRTRQARRGRGV